MLPISFYVLKALKRPPGVLLSELKVFKKGI